MPYKKNEVYTSSEFIDILIYHNNYLSFMEEFDFEKKNLEKLNFKKNIYLLYILIIYIADNCLTERQKKIFFQLWVLNRGNRQFGNSKVTYQADFNIYKACIKNIKKALKFTGYMDLINEVFDEKIFADKKNS